MYVSKERVLLDSAGTKKTALYYTKDDIQVADVECDFVTGRYSQSVSSLAWGSTSQFTIPNSDFLSQCILHVELPDLVANQTLPRGWLIAAIKEITYSVGSSNISQIRLSGKSLYHALMVEACTAEQRLELLSLAGEAYNTLNTKTVEGSVILRLPWSSMSHKLPLDTSLLNNPIQISITFHSADRFYGGSAAAPASMVSGKLFTRQGVLTDKSNSLRRDLMNNSDLMYSYPFIHLQSPSTKFLPSIAGEQVVEISEFLNSDLTSIIFSLHYTAAQKNAGTTAPYPNVGLELTDIQLLYNGQTIYEVPGRSGRLINMLWDEGASWCDDVAFNPVGPYTESPVQSFVYCIPMGDMKSIVFEGKYDNVSRYSTQSFQLRFVPVPVLPTDADQAAELHITHTYNAIATFSQGLCNIQYS